MSVPSSRLLLAACCALAALLAGTAWNAISLRRLEADLQVQSTRVAALRTEAEQMQSTLVDARDAARPIDPQSPGLPSTVEAIGWRGRRALVLHVEGAAEGAPLRPADKPRPQGGIHVARRTSAPSTLNPLVGGDGEAAVLTAPILGRLVAVDPDAPPAVVPSLATQWAMSSDGLECTYFLRHGVQFADGRPFTSRDVQFSFDVVRDPAIPADSLRALLADVVSVRAPDPFTVIVTFAERNWRAPLVFGNALRILNKGWYDEELPLWANRLGLRGVSIVPGQPGFAAAFNAVRIPCPGTGPYYFAADDLESGKPVELVRNPFSWAMQVEPERYSLDGLRWVVVADDRAALDMLKKGLLDSTVVDLTEWDDVLSKDAALTAVVNQHEYDHSGLGALSIVWNCRKPPFDDARVRRAMSQALDAEGILREVARGHGVVPTGPAKTGDPRVSPDIAAWPHDEAAARQLLADAGWTDTNADGRVDRGGTAFEFTLLVGSTRPLQADIARRFASACQAIGVRANVSNVDWATYRRRLDERAFDAAIVETTRSDPWYDPREDFHSAGDVAGGGNLAGWHDDEADALLDSMRAEVDDGKRRTSFHRFHAIFHEQQPWTIVLESRVGVLISKRFAGVKIRPTGIQTFDMYIPPAPPEE